MKRRKALKQIGLGLSGGMLMPSLLDACASKDPGPEISFSGTVGIIGAGAAGLYAADILRSKGINVIVFEARDQIGGRVCSLRNQSKDKYPSIPLLSSDFPLELGAQTTVGSDSILGKIFRDYNLTTVEFTAANNVFVLDKVPKTAGEWGADADFTAAKNFVANIKNNAGSPLTVQQAAEAAGVSSRGKGMINGQLSNYHGSNSEKIGVGALGEDDKLLTNDRKVLTLRSNPLQDILISRFSGVQPLVKLNTPITSINYSADPIVLTAKDGTKYEVNKLVVTVPVSVLKIGKIAFSPGLSGDFLTALSKFAMGPSFRMLIEFKKNFWGDSTGFIWGSSGVPEYLNVGLSSGFNQTLSVTINGDRALDFSSMGGDLAINTVIADLDAIYGGQASLFIRKDTTTLQPIYVFEDWTKRDYIFGGYSYPLPGAKVDDRKALGKSVGGKLFFAGEATDISGQSGMLNGALASAERVVQEVVTAIKNPT